MVSLNQGIINAKPEGRNMLTKWWITAVYVKGTFWEADEYFSWKKSSCLGEFAYEPGWNIVMEFELCLERKFDLL